MVEVKICGVCRPEDARAAAAAGATWLGVILAPGRTRSRTAAEAAAIFEATELRRVGVFVDAPAEEVIAVARDLRLDAVQLHGDESVAVVQSVRAAVTHRAVTPQVATQVWKALHVRDAGEFARDARVYAPHVDALLLDGWSPDAHGGAGVQFDWAGVAAAGVPPEVRLIAAGGLTPANVATAIRLLRPAIVDVSSGVEEAPGRKSARIIQEFVAAAIDTRISS